METERQNICLAKNVGTYLKHKLRSTQMTQAQFAERMGVEERTVRRWVSGDIHKIEIIEDIACMFQDDITSVVTYESDDAVHFKSFILLPLKTCRVVVWVLRGACIRAHCMRSIPAA